MKKRRAAKTPSPTGKAPPPPALADLVKHSILLALQTTGQASSQRASTELRDWLPETAHRARRALVHAPEGIGNELRQLLRTLSPADATDLNAFCLRMEDSLALLLARIYLIPVEKRRLTLVVVFQIAGYPVGCDINEDYAALAALFSVTPQEATTPTPSSARVQIVNICRLSEGHGRSWRPWQVPELLAVGKSDIQFQGFAWVSVDLLTTAKEEAFDIARQHLFRA